VNRIDQAGGAPELGGGGIAGQLEAGLRPALPEQVERRQRDEEIAERPAPKDQDFLHPARALPPGAGGGS